MKLIYITVTNFGKQFTYTKEIKTFITDINAQNMQH